jgi:hypothetical protein
MNEQELEILAAELALPQYAEAMSQQDYEGIAATLNAQPMIPNPTPQPQRDKFIDEETFVKTLKPQEIVTCYGQNGALVEEYRQSLQQNDRKITRQYWRGLKTLLSAETVTALEAMHDQKEPDPTWAAQIPGPSRADELGLPVVTAADVQAVEQAQAA